jgi:hypothetical protein
LHEKLLTTSTRKATPSPSIPHQGILEHRSTLVLGLAVFGSSSLSTAPSSAAYAEATDKAIVSRTANVEGVELHYMTLGDGTPLIVLHGYAETSLMWKPIIALFAARFKLVTRGEKFDKTAGKVMRS